MSKLTLNNIVAGYASSSALNAAFDAIEVALDNTVSRDGSTPNSMNASLDLNGQDIINGGTLNTTNIVLNGTSVAATLQIATDAAADASSWAANAEQAATDAEGFAVDAFNHAGTASTAASTIDGFEYAGEWAHPTHYVANNFVYEATSGSTYICLVEHDTTASFSTDYTVSGYWALLATKGAAGLNGTGSGDVVGPVAATTVGYIPQWDDTLGTSLGVGVPTTAFQAYSGKLASYVAQTLTTSNKIPYASAANTAGELTWNPSTTLSSSTVTVPSQSVVKTYVDTAISGLTTAVNETSHTIWIPASAMIARTTQGAAAGSTEVGSSKIMCKTLDFDGGSLDEFAQFAIRMPSSWNVDNMQAKFAWSHLTTAASPNDKVVWGIQSIAFSDLEDMSATAWPTVVSVQDVGGTLNTLYVSPTSGNFKPAGTLASGDLVYFQVSRVASDTVNDTLVQDARLHGVTLVYTVTTNTDTI